MAFYNSLPCNDLYLLIPTQSYLTKVAIVAIRKINQQPRSKLTRYEWAEKIILRGKARGIKPHNVSKRKEHLSNFRNQFEDSTF